MAFEYIKPGFMVFCRLVRAFGSPASAHVAQLAEHVLGKDEVIGSNPIMGSRLLNTEFKREYN